MVKKCTPTDKILATPMCATEASPLTKLVAGRGVDTVNPVDLLWTTASARQPPVINHFVPLVGLSSSDFVVGAQEPVETIQAEADANANVDGQDETADEQVPSPTGLSLEGHFLSNSHCVNYLSDVEFEPVYDTVPCGLKENVMFKVKLHGDNKFWDDCGSWEGTHGTKKYQLPVQLTELRVLPDGRYGTRKRVDGKNAVVPLEPQPLHVIVLHRQYSKLRRANTYQRRVTQMDGCEFCLIEYLGSFPEDVTPHGNAKKASEYVRSHPRVLAEVRSKLTSTKQVKRTYDDMKLAADDDLDRRRDKKQVENVAARMTGTNGAERKSSMNLADEIQSLMTMMTQDSEDFVQAVNVQLRRSPSVILFTPDQISDIRTLCSRDCIPELRSVLSFDRTFNLSPLFVTVMVFKHRKVVRKSTQEPPIFLGPMMLHGDGKFSTYLNFFSHINGMLNGSGVGASEFRMLDNVVTGSDDENALVNAAKAAFHNSLQLFCMLHVKDNVRHKLTSIGTATVIRETIVTMLFGACGVSEATCEIEQDDRVAELLQYVRQQNVDAVDYLQERVLPKILNNNRVKWNEAWIGQHQWTNNNCESANHVLKVQVSTPC